MSLRLLSFDFKTKIMEEIINKVANSALEVFDLEDYYLSGNRIQIDISQWLYKGFLLKEADFRESLKNHNWEQYKDCFVAINCTTEAIIPAWALILVTVYVAPFAKKTVSGNISNLESALYDEILSKIDFKKYEKKAVILKGCSKKAVPESAYIYAIQHLQKYAKSVMYGEACSAVPLFKTKIN